MYVGQTVQWFKSNLPNEKPWAAIVVENNGWTLDLVVFQKGIADGAPKFGVRHAEDPSLTEINQQDSGCWRPIPEGDDNAQAARFADVISGFALSRQNDVIGGKGFVPKTPPPPATGMATAGKKS